MNKSKIYVCPSILAADFSIMKEELKRADNADMLHCDVMDGMFVPNISFGPKMIKDINKHTDLPLDVHLMIEQPQRYIEDFAGAGADYITVHYEACGENLRNVLLQIKALNKKCGAVINPATPAGVLEDCIDICDMVLLMSVNPGFGGQKFIEPVLKKVSQVRKMIDNSNNNNVLLEIDGGINQKYAPLAVEAGANVLVAGSYLFAQKDTRKAIEEMRNL